MMIYNPYLDKYEHEGIRYLQVTKPIIEALADSLLWANEVARGHLAYDIDVISNIQNGIDFAEMCLSECLYATRTYYEYWLLHHQLRVIFLMATNLDIGRMYLETVRLKKAHEHHALYGLH